MPPPYTHTQAYTHIIAISAEMVSVLFNDEQYLTCTEFSFSA